MSKTSKSLLPSSQGHFNLVGQPLRADELDARLHTVAIYLNNFKGKIIFEASIASLPDENDWFVTKEIQFPQDQLLPTGSTGDSGTFGFNLEGKFTWIRARVDRSEFTPEPTTEIEIAAYGYVDRILINN